jgi:hypothetical protein
VIVRSLPVNRPSPSEILSSSSGTVCTLIFLLSDSSTHVLFVLFHVHRQCYQKLGLNCHFLCLIQIVHT